MCNIDDDLLQSYIDHDLNEVEKLLFEEHLKGCNDCRRKLNQLKLVDWELFHQPLIEVPEQLADIREKALNKCFEELEIEETNFGIRDVMSVQAATVKGAAQFVRYIPGQAVIRLISEEVMEAYQPKLLLKWLLLKKVAK
ncbi:MAG: zf-HC2 domain-containing protein [Bacillota bacterium]|nr:zf-HC2 domain-containing protein [Bacillota bacterium]